MKIRLSIILVLALGLIGYASEQQAGDPVVLPAEDQQILEGLSKQISQMAPEVAMAEKAAQEAERALYRANAFINQYNALVASRQGFINRLAADVIGCKTTDLELTTDGRGLLRKKVLAAKPKP